MHLHINPFVIKLLMPLSLFNRNKSSFIFSLRKKYKYLNSIKRKMRDGVFIAARTAFSFF